MGTSERWQLETSPYREAVLELAQSSPAFSGAQLKPEARELLTFGVGEPAAALAAEIERAPANIRVVWREAPYSLAELIAEANRVMSEQRGRINSISPRHDGTGLHITTTDRRLLEAPDPQEALATRYPVAIEYEEIPIVTT